MERRCLCSTTWARISNLFDGSDTRAEARTFLREAYQVQEDNLERRAAVAAVVVAWETSKEFAQKDV